MTTQASQKAKSEDSTPNCNISNRTVFTRDNLEVLRGINSNCIDLIYLDPPFNSNRNYAAPIGSEAAGAAFKDTWELNDLDEAWHNEIADKDLTLYKMIDASEHSHGKSMKSYLIMMAVRLLELKRVLKDTGSIYLHCDPTAGHYLKMLMDAIFGSDNYQNDIVWRRYGSHNDASRRWGRVHDNILFYSKSDKYVWTDEAREPYDDEYIQTAYRNSDERGRYTTAPLHGRGLSGGGYEFEWRGIIDVWRFRKERLEEMDKQGLIHWPQRGRIPRRKVYLDPDKGIPARDVVSDINIASRSERMHYPTQKPLALLKRIIKASSNEGDIILDPFCGCATACEAAEKLDRRWIGIDLSPQAINLVNVRMKRMFGNQLLPFSITARTDIPTRTDLGPEPPRAELKQYLYGLQGGYCKGCGEHFPPQNLTLDRIIPGAKGGTYHAPNVQLMCSRCNSIKGDRPMEYLRMRLAQEYGKNWRY